MAQITTISTKELKRQASLVFEGLTLKVMLCELTSEFYDAETTVALWQTIEKSGSGYSRFSGTVGVGAYNSTLGRYELPTFAATFTATAPYTYNAIVIYFNGQTYPHSVILEEPNLILSASQIQSYLIDFHQDD